jgi:single-stranded-DNA-specific exonuclease
LANWIEPQPIDVPDALLQVVPVSDGWEKLVAELLVRRDITDPDAARSFLDPAAYRPASPFELPGLARAVERIAHAIREGTQIAIWGDFDVDGQTATALYLSSLQALGAQARFTIPTRIQSHGVHPAGVLSLIEEGVELIVTADTGVSAHAAVDLAARQGVDLLVTDHHDLPPTLPAAHALVDPKLLDADHPLYGLPGVGVAYQVVRALEQALDRLGVAERALDLVALGIVADVAMLTGDTRYLLQRGLEALRRTERPGLVALMASAEREPIYLDEEDIGFALAPRLNALSRVAQEAGDARDALGATSGVELLTTEDEVRARTLAAAMEALNARRRWLTRQTFDAALAQLEDDRSLLDRPAIVVGGANWDPGIVGIVAGRLVERYNRPAIVFSAPPGEIARGSARSIRGIDIHAAIADAAASVSLHRYGGHPMAAGLSLDEAALGAFRRALWQAVARTAPQLPEPELRFDAELTLDQLSLELVQAVNQLKPFGLGNEPPLFCARGLRVASNRIIGRTRAHRRLVVRDESGRQQEVLWWYSADRGAPEGAFDLAFQVSLNRFRGEVRVQLTWVGARPLQEPAVQVAQKPPIAVRDARWLGERGPAGRWQSEQEAMLRALLDDSPSPRCVWGEGPDVGRLPEGVDRLDRRALRPAATLVVWTAPPSVTEWEAALAAVAPQEVVLVCLDPGMDAPRAFLRRLAGMVNYALREYGGQTRVSTLAAATAQTEWAVRLGLRWLAARGQVMVELEGSRVRLRPASGGLANVDRGDREREPLEAQLRSELQEAAAYRAYMREADAKRLVNGDVLDGG